MGKKRALVAVMHKVVIAMWHMLSNDVTYHDLGGDYFTRLDPERAMHRLARQANALGYTVRFDPIEAA
ncbi:hypothetical protein AB0H92_46730 [Streptomyces phaeochromogenes]|uniref:hypothetical protein n=1 Tax=Streptomyces phaeochromogenes TaxID=1923 RepID=UPI00340B78BA